MKTLKIEGLFGHRSCTIDISDRCLVLIGENGSGKSTILKMIKALSELNFIELSKYRFDSIEYIDDSSKFKIKFSDIMPNNILAVYEEYIDQLNSSKTQAPISFDAEFFCTFISICRELFNSNRFGWILSCIFHGRNIDKSDLQLLEKAKLNAFEQSAFMSILENSFQSIDQIDIFKKLKDAVKATEFSTVIHGMYSSFNFDIKLYEGSSLYNGKFEYNSENNDINSIGDDLDDSIKRIITDMLPNEASFDDVCEIVKIESIMNLGNCLLIDMTSNFDLVNNPCHESSTEDDPSLFYLRNMDISASRLGVDVFSFEGNDLSDEIRKLHIDVYQQCIASLNCRFTKDNDNNGRFAQLPGQEWPALADSGDEELFLNQFVENRQINISELISDTFFSNNTKIEINVQLYEKYVDALMSNQVYIVDAKNEMYDVLATFFFDKYYELKDWFKPTILKNSIFDFDYDTLRATSKIIKKLEKEAMSEYEEQQSTRIVSFNFTHVIFYDFYNNEFKKFKKRHTKIIDNFVSVLSRFLFNKKITVSPSGMRIENQSGVEIDPMYLSSGERKVLILLLISMFITDVTLLLDEPEISISVIWQSMLLPTLLNDTSINRIMVATQSPFLVEDEDMIKYLQALS